MKLPISLLMLKIKDLGLMDETSKVITFAKFKKLIDIHQYGKGQRKLFILYVGNPKENCLAFYPPTDTRPEMLKIAYEYLVDTVTTELKQEYMDGNVVWGNCGYPLSYAKIRSTF